MNFCLILGKTGHVYQYHGTIQDKLGLVAVLFEDVDQTEPTDVDGPAKIRSVYQDTIHLVPIDLLQEAF